MDKPTGRQFFDSSLGIDLVYMENGEFKGWLCRENPAKPNSWYPWKKATADDIKRIADLLADKPIAHAQEIKTSS